MRYTNAFEQQWTMRAETRQPAASERILSVLHPYRQPAGPQVSQEESLHIGPWLGVMAKIGDLNETTLYHRDMMAPQAAQAEGITTDAAIVSFAEANDGTIRRFLVVGGAELAVKGRQLLWAEAARAVACTYNTGAASAQIDVAAKRHGPGIAGAKAAPPDAGLA